MKKRAKENQNFFLMCHFFSSRRAVNCKQKKGLMFFPIPYSSHLQSCSNYRALKSGLVRASFPLCDPLWEENNQENELTGITHEQMTTCMWDVLSDVQPEHCCLATPILGAGGAGKNEGPHKMHDQLQN